MRKIAHSVLALVLALVLVISSIPMAFAAMPAVGITGGTIKESKNIIDGDYPCFAYIIEVPSFQGSLKMTIDGDFSLDDFYGAYIRKGDADDYTTDISYTQENDKTVTIELKTVPLAPNFVVEDTLGKSEFQKWAGKDFLYIQCALSDGQTITLICYEVIDESSIDKSKLETHLKAVPAEGYYTENDRWNGRTASENGFWADMQTVVANGQSIFENTGIKQEVIDQATADLDQSNPESAISKAIDNLIPDSQANTTALYEAIDKAQRHVEGYEDNKNGSYVASSWNNFKRVLKDAEDLLDSLFDENGKATEANTADQQPAVDEMAELLTTTEADLFETTSEERLSLADKSATALLNKTVLQKDDYTPESWEQWSSAYDTLKKEAEKEHTTSSAFIAYRHAVADATYAYNHLEDRKDSITVHVSVTDNFGAKHPKYALKDFTNYNSVVTLQGDKTLAAVLEKIHYTGESLEEVPFETSYWPGMMAYVNEELVVRRDGHELRGVTYLHKGQESDGGEPSEVAEKELHDGDRIVLNRVDRPTYSYYGPLRTNTDYERYYPFAGVLDIDGPEVVEVEAGEAFDLSVRQIGGAMETLPEKNQPAENVTVFISDPADSEDSARKQPALNETSAVTGKNGDTTASIYQEGWYRLSTVNVTDQTPANQMNNGNLMTGGAYPHLPAGDAIIVHVTKSSDEAGVRARLLKELNKAFEPCTEYYCGNRWADLNRTYQDAVMVIKGEVADKLAMGDAAAAKDNAVNVIREALAEIEEDNENFLNEYRPSHNTFSLLPDDPKDLTQGQKELFESIKELNESATGYQLDLLTPSENEKYEALLAVYGEDGSELPPAVEYKLHIKVNNPEQNSAAFDVSEYAGAVGKFHPGLDSEIVFTPGHIMALDFVMPMWIRDGYEYQITDVDCGDYDSNIDWYDPAEPRYTAVTESEIEQRYSVLWINFALEYHDMTIYVTVQKDGAAGSLDEYREMSVNELTKEYQSIHKSDYTQSNWSALTTAYNNGCESIMSAKDEESIDTAKSAAIAAMAAVVKRDPAKDGLGTVTVTVTNDTYPDAPFTGCFVEEEVELTETSTMMTAALQALESAGFTWAGTGGDKYDINYLAGIEKDGERLYEFDGGSGSGWMATLNDWFTSEGLQMYTTAATDADHRLVDGDSIELQYTCALGDDLGGSWGNGNTKLKNLTEITGGTLSPKFESDNTKYVLQLTEGSDVISFKPTAANKNYQVRTYVNQKTGDNWYKRGEPFSVREGDTIYIGIGGDGWPSMNRNPGFEVASRPTWYEIQVVGSEAIQSVEKLIQKIGYVDFNNYQMKVTDVNLAKSAYDALSEDAQMQVKNRDKLFSLVSAVEKYSETTHVIELLEALPNNSKATDLEVSTARKQILDAGKAYEALDQEQRGNVPAGVEKNYNALLNRLKDEDAANQAAAAAVDAKIAEIGKVTLDSKTAIEDARKAYDELTEAQQALVKNLSKLVEAEETLAELEQQEADKAAAAAVDAKIAEIGKVTLDSKSAIANARKAYDELTEAQQALVKNLSKLVDAEEALAKLEQQEIDKAAAAVVDAKIAEIGEVTLERKEAIEEARKAYDELTEAQKLFVTKQEILTRAEAELAKLEQEVADKAAAAVVDAMIEAIGEVKLESKTAITDARAAYDELTEAQQALVKNLDVLVAAEERLAELEQTEVDKADAAAVDAMIEAIGHVTISSKATIENARKAYDDLTEDQQALVKNLDVLVAAEARLAELEEAKAAADVVNAQIENIGKVSADSEQQILDARKAYEALTDEQKAFITKLDVLTDAEAQLLEVLKPVAEVKLIESTGKPYLTWNKVDGAVKYEVWAKAGEKGEFEKIFTTSGTHMTNTSAEAGETYTYQVRAITKAGTIGNFSESVSLTAAQRKLAAPVTTLTGKTNSGKPYLTWNKVDGAVEYEVYRKEGKGGTYELLFTTSGTRMTNTSAKPGETYYYKVRAVAADGGKSLFSDVKYRTCDCARPELKVMVRTSDGKPVITWNKVDGAVKYIVYRSVDGGQYEKFYTTSGTRVVNTSAKAGHTYSYKVKAISENKYANSVFSQAIQVRAAKCKLEAPVTKLTVKNSNGKPYLTWNKVKGAAKYEVYRKVGKNGDYELLFTTAGTRMTNTSAKPGETYYYKVRAVAADGGKSAFSAAKHITCDCARPVLKVETRNGHPYLSWNKVDGAVKYVVYRADGKNSAFTKLFTTTGTHMTNTSAKAGHTYSYKVEAICANSYGNSAPSTVVTVKAK